MAVQHRVGHRGTGVFTAVNDGAIRVLFPFNTQQSFQSLFHRLGASPKRTKRHAARLVDQIGGIGQLPVLLVNFAVEIVDDHGYLDFFFGAKQLRCTDFLLQGAMLPHFLAGMRFTHVNEEERHIVPARIVCEQVVHATDGARRKGAGS